MALLPGLLANATGSCSNAGAVNVEPNPNPKPRRNDRKETAQNAETGGAPKKGKSILRGWDKDSPDVRMSKTLSWLLRHGARGEGIPMRKDGYVMVTDLLANPRLAENGLDIEQLMRLVESNDKKRYDLKQEVPQDGEKGVWWIRANQGHTLKDVQVELKPINSATDIPSGIAVHGTSLAAWESIAQQGLSKMKRQHIHLAQGVPGTKVVVSGMRRNSQVLIFLAVQRAIDAGIKFFISDNGVILTAGDENGFLKPEFFERVEGRDRVALPGWEGQGTSCTNGVESQLPTPRTSSSVDEPNPTQPHID